MRKTKPKKRILLPDPKFNDVLVTRFVNDLMVDGKKTVAFKIFYDALDIVEEKMAKKETLFEFLEFYFFNLMKIAIAKSINTTPTAINNIFRIFVKPSSDSGNACNLSAILLPVVASVFEVF